MAAGYEWLLNVHVYVRAVTLPPVEVNINAVVCLLYPYVFIMSPRWWCRNTFFFKLSYFIFLQLCIFIMKSSHVCWVMRASGERRDKSVFISRRVAPLSFCTSFVNIFFPRDFKNKVCACCVIVASCKLIFRSSMSCFRFALLAPTERAFFLFFTSVYFIGCLRTFSQERNWTWDGATWGNAFFMLVGFYTKGWGVCVSVCVRGFFFSLWCGCVSLTCKWNAQKNTRTCDCTQLKKLSAPCPEHVFIRTHSISLIYIWQTIIHSFYFYFYNDWTE